MSGFAIVLMVLNVVVAGTAVWWLLTYRPVVYRWTVEAWLIRLCALVPLHWATRGIACAPDACVASDAPTGVCRVGELLGPAVSLTFLGAMIVARRRFSDRE